MLPTTHQRAESPVDIFWKPELPMEVAMRAVPLSQILTDYNISRADWDAHYASNPIFLKEVKRWLDFLAEEGAGFKLKCRLIAEHHLETIYKIIDNPLAQTKDRVKAMENVVEWAGYKPKPEIGAEGGGGFSIVIQMNNQQNAGA